MATAGLLRKARKVIAR